MELALSGTFMKSRESRQGFDTSTQNTAPFRTESLSDHVQLHDLSTLKSTYRLKKSEVNLCVEKETVKYDIHCKGCGGRHYDIQGKTKGLIFRVRHQVKIPFSKQGEVDRDLCVQCSGETKALPPIQKTTVNDSIQIRNESSTDGLTLSSHATYEGSYNVHGERDGMGKMTWVNGDVYTGDFFNGNRHGHGTLTFADGSEYVGEWECNQQHGIGTRRWKNGDCYTGQYYNGQRTGEGRMYFNNGDLYVGSFSDGIINGVGRYYYAAGQRFEGYFKNGKRHGKGKFQRADGSLDIGVYLNDVRRGIGVRWNAERTMAWRMFDVTVKKKISIPEAVAIDYDIDTAVQDLPTSVDNLV
jgi:hypothetical protein